MGRTEALRAMVAEGMTRRRAEWTWDRLVEGIQAPLPIQ